MSFKHQIPNTLELWWARTALLLEREKETLDLEEHFELLFLVLCFFMYKMLSFSQPLYFPFFPSSHTFIRLHFTNNIVHRIHFMFSWFFHAVWGDQVRTSKSVRGPFTLQLLLSDQMGTSDPPQVLWSDTWDPP